MQARAYEGYFEDGSFFSSGRTVSIPEKTRVVITVFDESVKKSESDEKERRSAWLKRLDEAIKLSADEELIYIPRSGETRPPYDLTDEDWE
jgi:hypothetical protein